MDKLIYTSMTGAKNNTLAQGVHANNLANMMTTGFRADFTLLQRTQELILAKAR
jgi:flagellar basal-body rod protein FlgF